MRYFNVRCSDARAKQLLMYLNKNNIEHKETNMAMYDFDDMSIKEYDVERLQEIIRSVYGQNIDFKGRTRVHPAPDARKIFCHILRFHRVSTTAEIGSYIDRDHSTVVIACNKCNERLETEKEFRDKYNKVLQEFLKQE